MVNGVKELLFNGLNGKVNEVFSKAEYLHQCLNFNIEKYHDQCKNINLIQYSKEISTY